MAISIRLFCFGYEIGSNKNIEDVCDPHLMGLIASNSLFVLLYWMGLNGFQKPICFFGLDGIGWPPIAYLFHWIGWD